MDTNTVISVCAILSLVCTIVFGTATIVTTLLVGLHKEK